MPFARHSRAKNFLDGHTPSCSLISLMVHVLLSAALLAACTPHSIFYGYGSHGTPLRLLVQARMKSEGLANEVATAVDLQTGHYRERVVNEAFSTELSYDGVAERKRDRSGGIHALNTPSAIADARTRAFIESERFLLPNFGGASVSCRGTGDGTVALTVRPRGGTAITLDVDSGLLSQTVMFGTNGTESRSYADYRTADGFVLPFEISTKETNDEPEIRHIVRYSFPSSVTRMLTITAAPQDFTIPLAGTSVPFERYYGSVVIYARINGSHPLPFILDSGGHAILTADAARALGIHTVGAGSSGGGGAGRIGVSYARVGDVQIGDAKVRDQSFLVIPYDSTFSARPPQTPLAGILGLELFERFGIRIDYSKRLVTLRSFATTPHKGAPLAISFDDDTPIVPAKVEGVSGLFEGDTGNSGATILFHEFLAAHTSLSREKGREITGSGTGGSLTLTARDITSFTIAGATFRNVSGYEAPALARGSFASQTEAGNIGYDIFARFVPTFDYSASRVYMEPASGSLLPQTSQTGLGAVRVADGTFRIVSVLQSSPASRAGLRVGDIITAINGRAAKSVSQPMLWAINRGDWGNNLQIRVMRGTDQLLFPMILTGN